MSKFRTAIEAIPKASRRQYERDADKLPSQAKPPLFVWRREISLAAAKLPLFVSAAGNLVGRHTSCGLGRPSPCQIDNLKSFTVNDFTHPLGQKLGVVGRTFGKLEEFAKVFHPFFRYME
jgi:hypothetical protein